MYKSILIIVLLAFQLIATAQEYKFYALSNNPDIETPLYLCKINGFMGTISIIEKYSNVKRGDYLALSTDNKHLLATSKNEDNSKSGIAQFSVSDNGNLTFIKNQLKTTLDQPCYVSFTPDMNYVLSANYGDDEISLYNFANSIISSEIDNIVKPDQSKGHFISTDPSGKYVHAIFLGLDKVFNYSIENGKFIANPNQESFSLPDGYGPRHLVFHPNNQFVYILNETNSSVTACSYNLNTGVITEIHNISMLPEGYTGKTNAAAIKIHPNGKFLYASNRGHNSIAAYKIADDGRLSLIEHEASGINFPRDFNISSDGKFMIIGNQKGNSISSFRIDEESGELNSTGLSLAMTSPVSLIFLPLTVEDTNDITEIINTKSKALVVFPNPTREILHFELVVNENITKIEMYNTEGLLVKNISASNIKTMNVSDLPKGMYLLRASTNLIKMNTTIIIE